MAKFFNSKFYLFFIGFIISVYWSTESSNQYYEKYVNEQQKISNQAVSETNRLVNDISNVLHPLPESAKQIADHISNSDLDISGIENLLKNTLIKHVDAFGVGVAFEPYQFNQKLRLYAPYFMRKNRKIINVDVADSYDYTEPQYKWYGDALGAQPHWNELYFGEVSQAWLVEYIVPIIRNNKPIGLVFISYTLSSLQQRIDLADLGEQGYSFVVDNTGRFIDYPTVEKVYSSENIGNLSGFNNPDLQQTLSDIKNRQTGQVEYLSDITNKQSWLHFKPIPNTDWSVITVFEKPDLFQGEQHVLKELLHVIIFWSVTIILLIGLASSLFKHVSVKRYWLTACCISLILSTDIAALWYISLQDKDDKDPNITSIVSHADLENFRKSYTIDSLLNRNDPPLYVPTGVFVQSIEFTSANNVIMTGYIWQRYHNDYHKGLSQGIVMPEAESVELEDAFSRTEGETLLLGWYFKVTLRQNFDYGHYPLDHQSVWIRLWHKDFDKNVVLVPHLDSYDRLNPDWLPGIENDFVLSGWELDRSYFNYHHNSYNTNFGITNYVGQSKFPELYYNIVLQRDFFDSFVSQLAPLVVVLLMLFAILVTSSKDEDRNVLLGFNTSGVLASTSALFFVVLVSHIDLRSSLAAKEIMYLETFYFVTYITILIVSINSILFSWGIKFPVINGVSVIQYQDNLIPKLLFWPMVSGQLLILTLLVLYPQTG